MKAKDVLSVLAFCTIQSFCLIPLGPSNPYYPIASYNGSREEGRPLLPLNECFERICFEFRILGGRKHIKR